MKYNLTKQIAVARKQIDGVGLYLYKGRFDISTVYMMATFTAHAEY